MSTAWGLIAGYAVALVLFQVLLYRYLDRRRSGPDEWVGTRGRRDPHDRREAVDDRGSHERRGDRKEAPSQWRPVSGDGVGSRICPECGTENEPDPTFDYCRNCATDLG